MVFTNFLVVGSEAPSNELCIVIQRPPGKFVTGKLLQVIRRTWATPNTTFFVKNGIPSTWPKDWKVPTGLDVWRSWASVLPRRCGWLFKVPYSAYLNLPLLKKRIECFANSPQLLYLGVPKIVSMGADTVFRVADAEAGIAVRSSLLNALPRMLDECLSRDEFRATFMPEHMAAEDVVLGSCLWVHNVQLHAWLDPGDEVYYNIAANVNPAFPGFTSSKTPYQQVMEKHSEESSFGTLQCVLVVVGLQPHQLLQLHLLMGKSGRWFKNIACVSGGITYPELTSAHSIINGQDISEPIISLFVRQSLQQCFLEAAFIALRKVPPTVLPSSSAATASGVANEVTNSLAQAHVTVEGVTSHTALAQEWRSPALAASPSVSRLRRGGHAVCVFVVATDATEQHIRDAESVLETWGATASSSSSSSVIGGLPDGVEVFLVGRHLRWRGLDPAGGSASILELQGDVDLGFLHNTVRVFYLWNYLASQHADDCDWFVKADADTFVNTWALLERLQRYFDPEKYHYLGTLKSTRLGSGRSLPFAYNLAVLSRSLLRDAAAWFPICVDDLVKRKLGRGAEDIDLAYCLDLHGAVQPTAIGRHHEVLSRAMLRVGAAASGDDAEAAARRSDSASSSVARSDLLTESGACTLFVHPVHADEMLAMHSEVLRTRAELKAQRNKSVDGSNSTSNQSYAYLCDWPESREMDKTRWQRYMKQEYHGTADCWMGEFTWQACCDTRIWGPGGHTICWDEEFNFDRCCKPAHAPPTDLSETKTAEQPSPGPPPRLPAQTPITKATVMTQVAKEIQPKVVARKQTPESTKDTMPKNTRSEIKPFSNPPREIRGNPKCWADESSIFNYDHCCLNSSAGAQDCWVWPYTRDFCCAVPLPPREPIRVGGLPDASGATRVSKRTARCPEDLKLDLLACNLSLDELGALFEIGVIGTGDKASGWHDYLGAYERFLLHLPLSANVLELGVRVGASLAMWSEYFPFGKIVGVDKCIATFNDRRSLMEKEHGVFAHQNVQVVEGNASDASVIERLRLAGIGDGFADVIVDDANHWAADQLVRFELFFPKLLSPGGVYIVEDVHIQAPYTRDGRRVRAYFTELSLATYISDHQILVGSHVIERLRWSSPNWRHQVESVSLLRDLIVVTKAS